MNIKFKDNEYWWGGIVHDGRYMPISEKDSYSVNLAFDTAGNQSVPFFLSNKGRYIWSERPFAISFEKGNITLQGEEILFVETEGKTLESGYKNAMNTHFPFSGKVPEKEFFTVPQYNTWVELTYNQNEKSILEYANSVIKNGYKPGIIMLDDTWQLDYGMWQFDYSRFSNPKAMIDELHSLGFTVMLWVVPYISADSPAFREAESNPNRLLRDSKGQPIIAKWWNGYSAVLDMSKSDDCEWMKTTLNQLKNEYGVDGFKFDGGNLEDFANILPHTEKAISVGHYWHIFGADNFKFHELKDTWKCCGKPYVQRLRDKFHSWGKEGLGDLIPDALNISITGHPFICPDMVGGGEWTCFIDGAVYDQELVVRSAQCSALFPMMQFSIAPWRILDEEHREYVKEAQKLHSDMGEEIYRLAQNSAKTGEPMMKALDYVYPDCGYETVTDQFILGNDILVAPVLEKGAVSREIVFPNGKWKDSKGNIIEGPDKLIIDAPLGVLPWYRKI